ncbi:MAG: putative capsid protein [Zuhalvirus cruti]|uniref:Capsid protein n=1 Tax=Cressdnaviricota sp. TaxID=2748378 RepID=A0A3G2YTA3_9VIRU|nr:MAG: putative capsid protein [Cressdnaviricota sp.]
MARGGQVGRSYGRQTYGPRDYAMYAARQYGPAAANWAVKKVAAAAESGAKRAFQYATGGPSGSAKRHRGSSGGGYVGTPHFRVKKCKTLKCVAKQVVKLGKRVREGEVTYDHRVRVPYIIFKQLNENESDCRMNLSKTSIDNVIDQLEYWDATTNSFTARNITSTTTQKIIGVDSVTSTLWMKNSYQTPIKLEVLVCVPKKDTTALPNVDYDTGITKVVTNTGTMLPENDLLKVRDSPNFNKNWRITRTVKKTLNPGQHMSVSNVVKDIQYEMSSTGTELFQKKLKSFCFFVRSHGAPASLGHNTAGLLVGTVAGQVDVLYTQRFIVKYDGGINAKRIYVEDQSSAIGATALTGVRPVTDNQAFTPL